MNKLLIKIIESFNSNEEALKKAIEADETHCDFSLKKAVDIISAYDNFKQSVLSLKLIAITNGNPYSTIVLCLQSILNKSKITICPNNVMNGLNSTIVNIIGECCPKTVKPEFSNRLSVEELADYSANYPRMNIMVVDDITEYTQLLKLNLPVRYVPIFSLDLFYDSNDFSSSVNTIDVYCDKHYINLNITSDANLERLLIKESKETSSRSVLILTSDTTKFEGVKKELDTKIVYMNFNPFDIYEKEIVDQIIATKPY